MSEGPLVLPTHPATPFLHSTLAVGDGVVRWMVPRTLLGVIPLGHRTIEVPFGEVVDVGVHRFSIRVLHGAVGVLLMVLPVANGLGWWSVPLFALGLWVEAASPVAYAWIRKPGGRSVRAYVAFAHLPEAEAHADQVRSQL